MDDLHFNNDHNKVAYLLKPKESQGFHKIIDFMNGLYIMYALTANPTINASLVGQFWGLASEVSLPDGVKGLVATIDGNAYTVTEASIRSVLQLDDLNAINTLTNAEIFDGLRAIGYATEGKFTRTKFLMYPRFLQIILDTETEDTTPYPAPLVTKKIFANMPHYQGPDMHLLAHMLNQGEPALTITSPIRDDDTGGGSFYESPPSPPLQLQLARIATLEAELKATKILHRDAVELDALLHLANAALHDPSASTTPSKPDNQEQSSEQEISPTTLDAQSSSGLDFTDAAILAAGRVSAGGADPAVVVSAGGADSAGTFIFAGVSVATDPSVASAPSSPIRDPAKGKAIATPSSPVTAPSDKELADQQAAILEAKRQELLEQELKQSLDAEQSTPRQAELDRIALNLTNEEWIGLVDQVWANLTLSTELLGADVSEDTFSVRMVELMNQRRKAIAEMKAKAKRDKPLTPAQQKEYMRAFVKNQSTTIYTTGWTWKDVRGLTDDQLHNVYNKIRRVVDLATAKDHHQQLKWSGETLESSESKKLKSSHSTEQSAELPNTTSVSVGATLAAGDPISAVLSVSVVPSVSAASSILAETPIAAGVSTTAGVSESAYVPIIDLLDSPPKATSLPLDPETAEQAVPLRKSSRKKSMARRRPLSRPSQSESAALPFDGDDPEAEFKKYLRQVSDDDEPAEPVSLSLVSDIRTWKVIPTEFGLGEIHVITRADGSVKRFSTLRELMHWVGHVDLMVLYGMVSEKYKLERATGIGLGLWSDLRTLITARDIRDASIIWDDQDQWEIRSWRFYALPAIHVLETEAGDIMYMFVDKKYPILVATIQRMLNHGLEIDRDPSDLLKVCRALTMSARVLNCPAFKLEEIVMAMMTCLKLSGVHYQCFTVAVATSCCSTLNPHTAHMTIYYWKLDNKQVTIQFRGGLLGIVIPAAKSSFLLVFYSCC
nr:xylulose kinase-1 [Tanacetum cinerariifolium]